MLDALIVGAGPAGLTAALYLARYRRSLLLVDAGDSRARYIPVSHNTPGFARGVGGEQLLEQLRQQARRYGAEAQAANVRDISRCDGGFAATVGTRQVRAANVVLATGVVDTLPPMVDVDAAIHAGVVRLCPVCDAYETTGKRLAVYGPAAAVVDHACYLRSFCTDVHALSVSGEHFASADCARLAAAGVQVFGPTDAFERVGDAVLATGPDGRRQRFDALYPFLGAAARSELATALGAGCDAQGELRVDRHQQATVEGLYAIGDVVSGLNQISVAVGHAALAATAIHNRLPAKPL